jgi:hypothetical protein
MNVLKVVFTSLVTGVKTINRKYAEPQIEMTSFVKVCLVTLRLYLFLLIGLMIYKFIITIK